MGTEAGATRGQMASRTQSTVWMRFMGFVVEMNTFQLAPAANAGKAGKTGPETMDLSKQSWIGGSSPPGAEATEFGNLPGSGFQSYHPADDPVDGLVMVSNPVELRPVTIVSMWLAKTCVGSLAQSIKT